ncbi:MAG: hypothetical protein KIH01_08335 [Candidatus Freyarchaeota archaeon]|nr:hypothetical protein [Candidatus Jordarchaeia archaeon]
MTEDCRKASLIDWGNIVFMEAGSSMEMSSLSVSRGGSAAHQDEYGL